MAIVTGSTQKSSDYQQRFRTYHNYFRAWQLLLESSYGSEPTSPLTVVTSHPKFPRLMRSNPVPMSVTMYLRNAWSTEYLLQLPLSLVPGDTRSLIGTYSCAWAPVQAYYSVYSGLMAAACAEAQTLRDHNAALNFASRLIEYPWVPDVFSYWCRGFEPARCYSYSPTMPPSVGLQISNLRTPSDTYAAEALIRTCLKTTRREICLDRTRKERDRKRKQTPRATVSRSEKMTVDSGLRGVTLFDFLYRVRCRCNYQEMDTFIKGATVDGTAESFLNAVNSVVSHTLAFLETVVCGRIGKKAMSEMVVEYFRDTGGNRIPAPVAVRWGLLF